MDVVDHERRGPHVGPDRVYRFIPDDVWADVLRHGLLYLPPDRSSSAGVSAGENVGWKNAARERRSGASREIRNGSGANARFNRGTQNRPAGGERDSGIAERR